MAVIETSTQHETEGDSQALFEEARRRRRRRRLVVGVVATVVLVAAVALILSGGGGNGSGPGHRLFGRGHPGGSAGKASNANARATAPVELPARYWFNSVTTQGPNLLLTGIVATANPSDTAAGDQRCVAALMSPRTLKLGRVTEGSCNDPALSGETVTPVILSRPDTGPTAVAVVREDPATGVTSTGPVVMSFNYASDTTPVTTYGDGSMWLYDVATTNGPEVLQISEATGQVTDTAKVPSFYKPVLAADDDGLWIGNSVLGGTLSNPLWHVAPGATSAVAVAGTPSSAPFDKPGVGRETYDVDVFWLVANGDHVWAGMSIPGNAEQTIWRFDGPAAHVAFSVADHGYDPTAVVGGETTGLWTAVPFPPLQGKVVRSPSGAWITPGQNKRQDIIEINPDTGAETVRTAIAPLPTLAAEDYGETDNFTVLDGSFYILQPPFRADGYLGAKFLVRVRG